jgi:carbonic anhydrase
MSTTDELLRNAESYAASFDKGDLPLPPARKIAVLACMDARLNPYGLLGLHEGDAHVIRNAGGVVTDHRLRDAHLHRRRVQALGPGRRRDQARVGGRGLPRPRRGRAPVGRPRQGEPFIPRKDSVRGFVYEVESGRLREVT